MALGLKGGFSLAESGFNPAILRDLVFAIGLALIIPFVSFIVLKRVINPLDALAISATYGSVSAVTFITATQFLETNGLEYGGHMAAAMALMESPAIIFAILMANLYRTQEERQEHQGFLVVMRESFTEGAQILLVGTMVIGMITGVTGKTIMDPFTGMIFKGMLAFFLLDMGVATAKRIADLRGVPKRLAFYGVIAPLTHASIALTLAMSGWSISRQCNFVGRPCRIGFLHRCPSCFKARITRIQSKPVSRAITWFDVPVQHYFRYPAVSLGSQLADRRLISQEICCSLSRTFSDRVPAKHSRNFIDSFTARQKASL